MDDESLRALPRTYSLALRLRAIGADADLIGDCLELEPSAVPLLLELAEAKLRAVVDGGAPPSGGSYHAPR